MVLSESPQSGSAGHEQHALRAAQALLTAPGAQGFGSGEYKHVLLIQLPPAEHCHRLVASCAVSEPAARMPSHGAAAGAESDLPASMPVIWKDIL